MNVTHRCEKLRFISQPLAPVQKYCLLLFYGLQRHEYLASCHAHTNLALLQIKQLEHLKKYLVCHDMGLFYIHEQARQDKYFNVNSWNSKWNCCYHVRRSMKKTKVTLLLIFVPLHLTYLPRFPSHIVQTRRETRTRFRSLRQKRVGLLWNYKTHNRNSLPFMNTVKLVKVSQETTVLHFL